MPEFTGKYAYLVPGRGVLQEGACQLSFDEQSLTLVPQGGPPFAFDLGDIAVFEPGEYDLRLILDTGQAVRLEQFGKAFQDLARQLLEAYRDRLVRCLLVSDLDEVARYTGRVGLDGARPCQGAAEIRLYESNLAILPDAAVGFQWRLAEIEAVDFDERDYQVVIRRRGERLVIGRLAKRTGELVERLRQRIDLVQQRSARVLHALFPFLSAEEFRRVAGEMREGSAAPVHDLRAVHRLIERALLERVVDGGLRPYLNALVERSASDGWYAGFKIVRRDAGEEPAGEAGEDPAEEAGEGAEQAEEGASPDPAVTQVGDDLEVLYWFFFPLASGTARPSRLAWEATSHGGRATYVFDAATAAPGAGSIGEAVRVLNSGLVAVNFRREPVYLKDDTLLSDARYRHYAIAARKVPELALVRRAFAGRAIHRSLPAWQKQLDAFAAS